MFVGFIGCIAIIGGVVFNNDDSIKVGFGLLLFDLVLELANIHNILVGIGRVIQKLHK